MSEAAEAIIDDDGFDLETLRGDLRDALLGRLRTMPKPWTVMSETEQQELIDGCVQMADNLVRKTVDMIASDGRKSITGTLEQYTEKDEIKAVLKFPSHAEHADVLHEMVGGRVLLVGSDPSAYLGEKAEARPDPEQPEIFEEGDAENVAQFKGRDAE